MSKHPQLWVQVHETPVGSLAKPNNAQLLWQTLAGKELFFPAVSMLPPQPPRGLLQVPTYSHPTAPRFKPRIPPLAWGITWGRLQLSFARVQHGFQQLRSPKASLKGAKFEWLQEHIKGKKWDRKDVLLHCLAIKSFFIPFKALLSSEIKLQIYSWGGAWGVKKEKLNTTSGLHKGNSKVNPQISTHKNAFDDANPERSWKAPDQLSHTANAKS